METAQELLRASARQNLSRRTVCVVMGGGSTEREVSLASGVGMLKALAGADCPFGDVLPLEIDARGSWILEHDVLTPGAAIERLPDDTIFLLALHGGFGENGGIQGFFDIVGRAHTGSGVAASALCMDKFAARERMRAEGLRVAPARLVTHREWREDRARVLDEARRISDSGHVVKPNRGGSSVATSLVEDPAGLEGAIQLALDTRDRCLVEARVVGAEASCGVLGNADMELFALTPVEIRPHEGRFFDYEEKYSESGALELCPPESLSAGTCDTLREMSRSAHDAARCDGYSRVDFMIPERGDPVFLEVNTLPGFTERSLFPQEARVSGVSFPELLHEVCALAVERFERDRV